MKILLVDFTQGLQARFVDALASRGFILETIEDVDESPAVGEYEADSVIVALQAGVQKFSRLRRLLPRCPLPVIVLADQPNPVDSIVALELGADDYLPNDCEPRELVARVRAVLRTRDLQHPGRAARLDAAGLILDLGSREAHCDGQAIHLTTTEFEILRSLMVAAGHTVSREELGKRVDGRDGSRSERALDVHISHLRRKLGARGSCIKTVRGTGYQFFAPNPQPE